MYLVKCATRSCSQCEKLTTSTGYTTCDGQLLSGALCIKQHVPKCTFSPRNITITRLSITFIPFIFVNLLSARTSWRAHFFTKHLQIRQRWGHKVIVSCLSQVTTEDDGVLFVPKVVANIVVWYSLITKYVLVGDYTWLNTSVPATPCYPLVSTIRISPWFITLEHIHER